MSVAHVSSATARDYEREKKGARGSTDLADSTITSHNALKGGGESTISSRSCCGQTPILRVAVDANLE